MAKTVPRSIVAVLGDIEFDEAWPHDPPGYLFLARAFDFLGRAIFHEKWAESADDLYPEEPPEDCDDEIEEEHFRVCQEIDRNFEKNRDFVARKIADECEAGNLVSAIRPKRGGRMQVLEPDFWNTEDYGERFSRWHMSSKRPFSPHMQDHWIFVTQESLSYCLTRLTSASLLNKERESLHGPRGLDVAKRRHRSGRTPGSGAYDVSDQPLLEEMRDLIVGGKAKSPHDAAAKVADKAQGASLESRQTRLGKKYRAKRLSDER